MSKELLKCKPSPAVYNTIGREGVIHEGKAALSAWRKQPRAQRRAAEKIFMAGIQYEGHLSIAGVHTDGLVEERFPDEWKNLHRVDWKRAEE